VGVYVLPRSWTKKWLVCIWKDWREADDAEGSRPTIWASVEGPYKAENYRY